MGSGKKAEFEYNDEFKNTEAGNIKFEKSEFGKIVKTESEYPFGKTEALKTEPVRIEAEHTEADNTEAYHTEAEHTGAEHTVTNKATFENSEKNVFQKT